jgi:hypothetical protein
MNIGRCKSPGCQRQRRPGSDRCYYCARVPANRQRLTPQEAARNIAAQLGERDDA